MTPTATVERESSTAMSVPEDAVYFLPPKEIHPDPEQPRKHPDEKLADSIATRGVLQAITVRPHPFLSDEWMIIDGERRWRGAMAAKASEIPCRIRYDLEDPAERLVTQLAVNTGEPLTKIDEARAFKRLMEDRKDLTHAELAKLVGVPRSTVGDRLRLLELDPVWLDMIESGKLQVSHAPVIHQYRAVPQKYQAKAAANLVSPDNWHTRRYREAGTGQIPVDEFRGALHAAFRDYIVPLDQVRSYKGPVLEIEDHEYSYGDPKLRKKKYAADINLWRPIKRAAEKRQRQRSVSGGGGTYRSEHANRIEKALKASPGIQIEVRKVQGFYAEPHKDEVAIFDDSQGWERGFDPQTLLEKLEPKDLVILQGQHGAARIVTTNKKAVDAARAAYGDLVREAAKKELAPLRAKLNDETLDRFAVKGAGAIALLSYVGRGDWVKIVALAPGINVNADALDEDSYDVDERESTSPIASDRRRDAERILAALAATKALKLQLPQLWSISSKVEQKLHGTAFRIPGVSRAKE